MKTALLSISIIAFALLMQGFTTLSQVGEESKPITKSKIVWKAYKVTGSHEGTIDLKSGSLTFDGDQLTGGKVVLDMTTIAVTDLDGEYKGKLEGHLKSDDFFGVEKHTTASLVVTKAKSKGKNAYEVKGDLTIKGITEKVTFQVSIYGNKATANLKIDRTKFDVRYGSNTFFDNLQDKAIYDEFDMIVDLEF